MAMINTHLLSGVAVVVALPEVGLENQILLILGTILPDFIFPYYFSLVSKKSGKKMKDMTENDYINFGHSDSRLIFLKKIYFFFHGIPFLFLIYLLSEIYNPLIFLALGLCIHFIYDIFVHHYNNANFRPKPIYPISSKTFNFGITNGWEIKPFFKIISTILHVLLIVILLLKF